MKQYHGNFAVSKIRFCSARCWETYRHNMEQRANELQDFNHQRERALQFIEEEPIEPGSLGWIMAAVTASREQHERMDVIANMV
ncbi:hypothetical protein G6F56_010681 [Rhizopus delemar]|nr:hypothetical protein G6F56_010681 [Rhizopus delemar]